MNFASGTPSLEEYSDCWKADLNEPDLVAGEYNAASDSLRQHLELRHPRGEWPPDLYVRGDCFGDKTQYLHFYLPEIINMEFLAYIQRWLQTYGKGDWRVLIATEIGDAEAVMVYPDTIRTGSQYQDDLPGSLTLFIQMMREEDDARSHPVLKPLPRITD
jgi:hypothetical protein